tara:strand:+ start:372 stop:677 length:306 start_codon:yes stop_codon:yes gene_type:complete
MEKIIDFNIYNYSIDEMEKLCQLKKNYTFSDISIQSHKTKKNIIKTYSLSSIKELEIDIFFQQLIARLERNLLNKNLNKVLDNQQEIKKILKKISLSKKNK